MSSARVTITLRATRFARVALFVPYQFTGLIVPEGFAQATSASGCGKGDRRVPEMAMKDKWMFVALGYGFMLAALAP